MAATHRRWRSARTSAACRCAPTTTGRRCSRTAIIRRSTTSSPNSLPDFGPYSVLLDFSRGIENPASSISATSWRVECDGADGAIERSPTCRRARCCRRITDHYMQILANQAPIGFEAEFVNQRGATILYRGILLPFSSDDDTIDFIYGVINWKRLADQQTADELLLEIDQALDEDPETPTPRPRSLAASTARVPTRPLTDWADGPAADLDDSFTPSAPESDDDASLVDEAGNRRLRGRRRGRNAGPRSRPPALRLAARPPIRRLHRPSCR